MTVQRNVLAMFWIIWIHQLWVRVRTVANPALSNILSYHAFLGALIGLHFGFIYKGMSTVQICADLVVQMLKGGEWWASQGRDMECGCT